MSPSNSLARDHNFTVQYETITLQYESITLQYDKHYKAASGTLYLVLLLARVGEESEHGCLGIEDGACLPLVATATASPACCCHRPRGKVKHAMVIAIAMLFGGVHV